MANNISVYGGHADGLGDHPATKTWLRGFHQIHRSFVHMARVQQCIRSAHVALQHSVKAVRESEDLIMRLEQAGSKPHL